MFVTAGDHAMKSSQQEGFDSITGIPESFVAIVHDLLEFRRSHFDLLDYDHIRKLKREVYPLGTTLNPDCHKLLRAFVARESETIKIVLIYQRKLVLIEKKFADSTGNPISYGVYADKATAELNEIAEELGVKLP